MYYRREKLGFDHLVGDLKNSSRPASRNSLDLRLIRIAIRGEGGIEGLARVDRP